MPRLLDYQNQMETAKIDGTFEFSAVRPDLLGATEYTLVTVAVDISGSVYGYKKEMLTAVKSIVEACRRSPRSDNLLIRLVEFNSDVTEVHGFKALPMINEADYRAFRPRGGTALYDAVYGAVGATLAYAKRLADQDFGVNAAVYIITDGEDNCSALTPGMIAGKVAEAHRNEEIESLLTILIGLAGRDDISKVLDLFRTQAQLTEYVNAGNAAPEVLCRLAAFVSQSIQQQSMVLGGGAKPPQLTF